MNHHNPNFDGGAPDIPHAVGDRYYSQDLFRDFRYLQQRIGQALQSIYGSTQFKMSGVVVSQGTGHTLNITTGYVFCKFQVYVQDYTVAWSIPPSKKTEDIYFPVYIPALTNKAISGTTNDGVTTNYAKIAYKETDGLTRSRAKKAGTYAYTLTPDYILTTNSTPPTAYETAIATFTTDGVTMTLTGQGSTIYNALGSMIVPQIAAKDGNGIAFYDDGATLTAQLYDGGKFGFKTIRALNGDGVTFEDDGANVAGKVYDGGKFGFTVVRAIGSGGISFEDDGGTEFAKIIDATGLGVKAIVRALSSAGIRVEDDAGNLGLFVEDSTGNVGVKTATPAHALDVTGRGNFSLGINAKAKLTGSKSEDNVFDWLSPYIPNTGNTISVQLSYTNAGTGNHSEGIIATRTNATTITFDIFDFIAGATTDVAVDGAAGSFSANMILAPL